MDTDNKKRKSGKRPKKYKFRGNQFTRKASSPKRVSASSKKIGDSSNLMDVSFNENFEGFCIIDKRLVFKMIEDCVMCKICGGDIKITSTVIAGLSEKIECICESCGDLSTTRNSSMLGKRKNSAEINSRFLYAMRALGQGHSGAKTFCGIMDL
jgi:hypothetical protein